MAIYNRKDKKGFLNNLLKIGIDGERVDDSYGVCLRYDNRDYLLVFS